MVSHWETQAEDFHTMVAKALFLSRRVRPNIQPMIAVMDTKLISPNITDWKKLVTLLKYLNGTRKYHLTLIIDDTRVIKWYLGASFSVHTDFKNHSGGIMVWGIGANKSGLMKQKLITRSSMEAEVVGIDDMASNLLWTKLFIEDQ